MFNLKKTLTFLFFGLFSTSICYAPPHEIIECLVCCNDESQKSACATCNQKGFVIKCSCNIKKSPDSRTGCLGFKIVTINDDDITTFPAKSQPEVLSDLVDGYVRVWTSADGVCRGYCLTPEEVDSHRLHLSFAQFQLSRIDQMPAVETSRRRAEETSRRHAEEIIRRREALIRRPSEEETKRRLAANFDRISKERTGDFIAHYIEKGKIFNQATAAIITDDVEELVAGAPAGWFAWFAGWVSHH